MDSRGTLLQREDSPLANGHKKQRLFSVWGEDPVSDATVAMERASAGAAYLDRKFGPSWDEQIDLERLAIHHPCRCIAGQLGPWRFLGLSGSQAVAYGLSCGPLGELLLLFFRPPAIMRSYDLLTVAWKQIIRHRRLDREDALFN